MMTHPSSIRIQKRLSSVQKAGTAWVVLTSFLLPEMSMEHGIQRGILVILLTHPMRISILCFLLMGTKDIMLPVNQADMDFRTYTRLICLRIFTNRWWQ